MKSLNRGFTRKSTKFSLELGVNYLMFYGNIKSKWNCLKQELKLFEGGENEVGLFGSSYGEKKTLELIEAITKTVERQDKLIGVLMEAQKSQGEQINSIYELIIQQAKNTAQHKIIILNLAKRVGLDESILEEYKKLEVEAKG